MLYLEEYFILKSVQLLLSSCFKFARKIAAYEVIKDKINCVCTRLHECAVVASCLVIVVGFPMYIYTP